MADTKVVTKSLALMEDMAVGVGTQQQNRAGIVVEGNKVYTPVAVDSVSKIADIDPALYTFAAYVYGTNVNYYAYDPNASSPNVASNLASGGWVLQSINTSVNDNRYIRVVADISTLRSIEPTLVNQTVIVVEHTIGQGSGGGTFSYISSSTAADDNGLIIVTAGGKRWKRQYEDGQPVDCRFFGIVPTLNYSASQTNYATAVLNAMAALGTNRVLKMTMPEGWTSAHYLLDQMGLKLTASWLAADEGVVVHAPFTSDNEGEKPRLHGTVVFSEQAPSAPNNYITERGGNNYNVKDSIVSAMLSGHAAAISRSWERIPFTQYSRPVKFDNLNLTYSEYSTGITIQDDQIFFSDPAAAGASWQGVEFAAQTGSDIEVLAENTSSAAAGTVMIGVRCMTSAGTGAVINMRLQINSDTVTLYNADSATKSITVYHPSEILNPTNGVRLGVRIVNNKRIVFLLNGKVFGVFNTGSTFVHSVVLLMDQAARGGVRFKYGVSHIRNNVQYSLPIDCMVLGDSTSRGARTSNEWPALLQAYGEHVPGVGSIRRMTNTAVSGWRLSDYIANLANYNFSGYSHVLVCLGTNDCQATGTAGVGVFASNLQTLITAIQAQGASPIIGMFPKFTAASLTGNGNEPVNMDDIPVFQEVIRYIAGNYGVQVAFIDDHFGDNYGYLNSFAVGAKSPAWYHDNIHPNSRGSMAYAAAFAEALSRDLVHNCVGSITKRLIPQGTFTNHTDINIIGELRVTRAGNTVTISGAISGGTVDTGGTIATLPTWALPNSTKYFPVSTYNGTTWSVCRAVVNNAGAFQIGNGYQTTRTDIQISYNV